MRRLRQVLFVLIAVAAIAAAVGWRLLAGSRPIASGTVVVAGLTAPVTIARDANGVPVITAHNRADLAYALGFVHGQERFFQMDLERRDAAGELAALVGPAALPLDENHRQHRFRALAAQVLAAMAPAQRHLIDAYTEGVNAGLDHLAVRPFQYLLLRTQPRPWTDADSVLTIDAMFFDLNQDGDDRRELDIARLRAVLPRALVDFLLAPDPRWEAPMEGGPTAPVPLPDATVFDLRDEATPRVALARGARAIAETDAANTGIGSNGFAVAGKLAGGAALLANDPHLALRVPNIWYRAELRYPDPSDPAHMIDLNGVTLPGAPAMVIGTNGHIAWGFTNTAGDWMDWVRVIHNPANPMQYKTPGGWATIQKHAEVIHVKGRPDVHLTVEDTIWGPIMGKDTDGTPLALAWIAQNPRAVNLNPMRLETATSVSQALALAPTMGIPPQNLVVADRQGNIGWTVAGSVIPVRAGFDPSVPADWSRPGTGWVGYATPAEDPRIEDPPDDRIWTANQRIVDGAALKLIGNGGYDQGARAQQIRNDLDARQRFTPRAMLDIELDDRALFLTRWQRLLLKVLDAPGCGRPGRGAPHPAVLTAAAAATPDTDPRAARRPVPAGTRAACARLAALKPFVADWQARATTGSVGYHIVRMFRKRVRENALAPFAARASARWPDFKWPSPEVGEYATWALVTRQPAWLLAPKYASWNALLADSAEQVAERLARHPGPLAKRTWGRHNRARIDDPLSVALPGWLARFFDMPRDELAGDNDMPRVVHPAFGASIRMDVQPGNEAHGILEMPAGQSDNPLSPWFGKGHEAWVHGQPTPLLPGPARYHLTLRPRA